MRRILLTILAVVAMAGCDGWFVRPQPAPKLADRPFVPASVKPFDMGRPDLVLLVTGGTNGMMETCNCPGPMPGGLARRSGLAGSYRAAFDSVFMLDCGDMFWVEPSDMRNGYVLQGYGQIGYDAVAMAVRTPRPSHEPLVPEDSEISDSVTNTARVTVGRCSLIRRVNAKG